jgi:hypothetical protein
MKEKEIEQSEKRGINLYENYRKKARTIANVASILTRLSYQITLEYIDVHQENIIEQFCSYSTQIKNFLPEK